MIHLACIDSDKRSQFTLEQIAVVLRARGFENRLHIYSTSGEALEQIPLERPDVIFLDLRTHGDRRAGLDVARVLRQHPLCAGVKLIGMADYAMPADRSAALAAGCHDFLPKPLRYQAVEQAITRLVHPDPVS